MADFIVTWVIDAEGVDSPKAAAEYAWAAMRRPDSMANVFDVTDADGNTTRVDLSEGEN